MPITLNYPGRGKASVHPSSGDYRCICRSMVVAGSDGGVYFTNARGDILKYNSITEKIDICLSGGMRKDYFGSYDWTKPGSMSYNWRQVFWHPTYRGGCILGVHGNSGYMFMYRPSKTGKSKSGGKTYITTKSAKWDVRPFLLRISGIYILWIMSCTISQVHQ